jgi:hypothetical protein
LVGHFTERFELSKIAVQRLLGNRIQRLGPALSGWRGPGLTISTLS